LSPTPSGGSVALALMNKTANVNQDSITSYPDSLRLRVKTSGGVTSGIYTISVIGAGSNGTPVHKRTITLNVNPVGLTGNEKEIPKDYSLLQNYPNPFNPTTNIRFDLPKAGDVKLFVYDITGKVVSTIVNGNVDAGRHNITFNAENLSSGIYFYKLETESFADVKKMMIIK
jgi:hypothetical protein